MLGSVRPHLLYLLTGKNLVLGPKILNLFLFQFSRRARDCCFSSTTKEMSCKVKELMWPHCHTRKSQMPIAQPFHYLNLKNCVAHASLLSCIHQLLYGSAICPSSSEWHSLRSSALVSPVESFPRLALVPPCTYLSHWTCVVICLHTPSSYWVEAVSGFFLWFHHLPHRKNEWKKKMSQRSVETILFHWQLFHWCFSVFGVGFALSYYPVLLFYSQYF